MFSPHTHVDDHYIFEGLIKVGRILDGESLGFKVRLDFPLLAWPWGDLFTSPWASVSSVYKRPLHRMITVGPSASDTALTCFKRVL